MFTKLALVLLALGACFGQVLMEHGDLAGTATTAVEAALTPTNVATGKFGQLGNFTCGSGSDLNFAQPLLGPHSGSLYLATLTNKLCKFDSTKPGSAPLWTRSFGTGRVGWSNNTDQFFYCIPASCNIGIVGTPVIDETAGFGYVVSASATPTYTLEKITLSDGSVAASQAISGSVVGTGYTGSGGDNTSGSNLLFKALWSNQRPGIMLSPDRTKIYVIFGGGSAAGPSSPPWHGWVMVYNTSLTQLGVFCTTPNSWGGSLWTSGAFDSAGNLYLVSGSEGNWDGTTEFPDTILKLSSTLTLLDWMTPSNHATNDANDYDFGSNWVRIITDNSGNEYAVAGGKDFQVYSVLTSCMGHLQGSGFGSCSVQQFHTGTGSVTKFSGSYAGVFMNNVLFLPLTAGDIYAFTWVPSTGLFTTTALWHQSNSYGFPGPAQMAGSCSGTSNCILWIVTAPTSTFTAIAAGMLRALSPADGSELWNSGAIGNMTKFKSPTVAGGKVALATQSGITLLFGLLPFDIDDGQTVSAGRTN